MTREEGRDKWARARTLEQSDPDCRRSLLGVGIGWRVKETAISTCGSFLRGSRRPIMDGETGTRLQVVPPLRSGVLGTCWQLIIPIMVKRGAEIAHLNGFLEYIYIMNAEWKKKRRPVPFLEGASQVLQGERLIKRYI